MKRCSKCKTEKPQSEFYKDKRTPDGLKSQCKKCHCKTSILTRNEELKRKTNREHMRSARAKNPEKFRIRELEASLKRPFDERCKARYLLNLALQRGDIVRPIHCEECGLRKKLSAHHEDYNKPFKVIWLCYECHGKKHRKVS